MPAIVNRKNSMNVPDPAGRDASVRSPRGLIVDLDGTLADTLDDLTDAVNFAIAPYGIPGYPREQIRPMVGDGLSVLIDRASRGADAVTQQAMIERFRAFYARHFLDRTRLYAGWEEALDAFAARHVGVCVLSNKPDDFTTAMVRRLCPGRTFVQVMGQREGIPLKPDPAAALMLCEQLNLAPGEVVFLGDSGNDMQTACRGGLIAVGAAWGFRPVDEMMQAGALRILHHPRELLELFGSR